MSALDARIRANLQIMKSQYVADALLAVLDLHKPVQYGIPLYLCDHDDNDEDGYPCPTVRAVADALRVSEDGAA